MTTLPKLRRKRRIDIPGLISRFNKNVASIEAQVEPFAQAWDDANELALHEPGPLWVVLGDSSSQGIGASSIDQGWVPRTLERLRGSSGPAASESPWRVVNLSMSGGRFLDVADRQLPVMREYLPSPDLVTCVIGGNDLTWRRGTDPIIEDARTTIAALPVGAVTSRVGGPGKRRALINAVIDEGARTRDLRLMRIWEWPSGKGALAADRFHPSDIGYGHMADLAWPVISEALGLE